MVFVSQDQKTAGSESATAAMAAGSLEGAPAPGMQASASPVEGAQHLSKDARQQLVEGERQFSLGLMRMLSVLARSSLYRHYTLADLEWLVIPPLRLGQCAILKADTPGLHVAAAIALWASVSPEVDLRLSQNLAGPIKLRPDEWRSGETLWLIDVVGSPSAATQLLSRLQSNAFKDRQVKVRRRNASGQVEIGFLHT